MRARREATPVGRAAPAAAADERPADESTSRRARQPRKRGPLGRLYHGETNIDFIGRTKLWFALSAIFLVIGLGSLAVRGLNLGIDFEGGAVFQVPTDTMTVEQARERARTVRPRRAPRSRSSRARADGRSGSRPTRSTARSRRRCATRSRRRPGVAVAIR